MLDFTLEIVRAAILVGIVVFLLIAGRGKLGQAQRGWNFIIGGFGLLLFGSLIDITDNFESLNRFVIIGDTEVEAILEKFVGFFGGFFLVAVGLFKWLPNVQRLSGEIAHRKRVERALREAHDTLEQQVQERTSELRAVTNASRNEVAERKRTEEALRKIDERLRAAI